MDSGLIFFFLPQTQLLKMHTVAAAFDKYKL